MKIGVMSDTHGNVVAFEKAMEFLRDADMILHAGDVLYHPPRLGFTEGYDIPALVAAMNASSVPIVIAQGNCDAQVYEELLRMPVQSPYVVAELNGVRIVVSHGHLLSRDSMIETGKRYKARYFVSGHTHIPVLQDAGGLILMNPGSTSIPKYEIGGRPAPSIGLITDDGARIISIDDGSTLLEIEA